MDAMCVRVCVCAGGFAWMLCVCVRICVCVCVWMCVCVRLGMSGYICAHMLCGCLCVCVGVWLCVWVGVPVFAGCIVKVKLEKNVFEADHGLITFRA